MVTKEAVQADIGPERTQRQLFTTWFTSLAAGVAVDHAMTDEEFAARRLEPKAVCGAVVMFAPMESPPGPQCPGCVAALVAAARVGIVLTRLQADILESLWVRAHHSIGRIRAGLRRVTACAESVPSPFSVTAATPAGDCPKPPAASRWPLTAAGAPAGTETPLDTPVSVSARIVSDTVPVTGARPAAQPSHPQSTGPGAVDAGLGGSQTAEVLQPRRVPLADCVPAAGAGQRHTPLPAAALSAATPEGRDRLDEATPHRAPARRLVQIHPTPTTAQLTPR